MEFVMNTQKSVRTQARPVAAATVAALTVTAVLCAQPVAAKSGQGAALRSENRDIRAQLSMLEKATAAFHSYDVANAAGWSVPLSECVASPAGGMGYHIANMEALKGAPFELSLLRPEVLLYAPLPDGSMEFLGVEYIVPYTPDNASNPPEMLGQKLQYNPVQEIWALHVWTERRNPDGIFAPFNPDVICPAG
jgi:hypothetical protein